MNDFEAIHSYGTREVTAIFITNTINQGIRDFSCEEIWNALNILW